MLVKNLFDTITFTKKEISNKKFQIEGNFSCKTEQNIIYKTYKKLLDIKNISKRVENFFENYTVKVEKNIPEFAGLGGGSSNAASFLKLINNTLSLSLDKNTLLSIGNQLGADVAFFITENESANVAGIGEIVKKFDEKTIKLNTITPSIKCQTPKVYKKFRENLEKNYDKIISKNKELAKELETMKSTDILKNFDICSLNDLFSPAIELYPKLKQYQEEGYFFSGSGSSFFKRIK